MSMGPPRPARGQKRAARYRERSKRLSLEKKDVRSTKGGGEVVKGVSKRIIVVDSPDPKIFERAIFIVREDFSGQQGVSESELLRQARQAAGGYLPSAESRSRLWPRLRGVLYAAAGAAATALAWIMLQMARI